MECQRGSHLYAFYRLDISTGTLSADSAKLVFDAAGSIVIWREASRPRRHKLKLPESRIITLRAFSLDYAPFFFFFFFLCGSSYE